MKKVFKDYLIKYHTVKKGGSKVWWVEVKVRAVNKMSAMIKFRIEHANRVIDCCKIIKGITGEKENV